MVHPTPSPRSELESFSRWTNSCSLRSLRSWVQEKYPGANLKLYNRDGLRTKAIATFVYGPAKHIDDVA